MARRPKLRFFLDNCVPDSVGRALADAGHVVIYQRDALVPDAKDADVAKTSAINNAILVSLNHKHFKPLASRLGVSNRSLRKLSRIDIKCTGPEATKRIQQGLSFIEAEWLLAQKSADKRLFVEVLGYGFKTLR
jgi:predicted nuclease of predicted toxin-antitoxin system